MLRGARSASGILPQPALTVFSAQASRLAPDVVRCAAPAEQPAFEQEACV